MKMIADSVRDRDLMDLKYQESFARTELERFLETDRPDSEILEFSVRRQLNLFQATALHYSQKWCADPNGPLFAGVAEAMLRRFDVRRRLTIDV